MPRSLLASTLLLVGLASCSAPQVRSINSAPEASRAARPMTSTGYMPEQTKAVAPMSSPNASPSPEVLAGDDNGSPSAHDNEAQAPAAMGETFESVRVADGARPISTPPADPPIQKVSERDAFVERISSMTDQELWEFGRQRREAMSETLRLTGKLELPKWDDLYTAEGTKREKALMLPTQELAALSKPELETRILATEGVPFVARLLEQLERAHGSSRAAIKYAKETSRKAAERERKAADAEAARLASIQRAGFSPEVTAKLNARKVWIGMTAAQVRLSWGDPGGINTTITKAGRSEQWVYGSGSVASYVYVQDGVVTALQL